MPPLHRFQWIDAQIRAGRYPNAKGLADAFEISRRQALRDFEYMRDSLGAPLIYSALHRGFTYENDAFTLPGPYVTAEQRGVLSRLATYYGEIAEQEGGLYSGMAALFRRLGDGAGAGGSAGARVSPPVGWNPARPYRARLEGGRPGAGPLQPYWRGADDYEFHDPNAFLAALLSAGAVYRVAWPGWLRERLQSQLTRMLTANGEVTHHVTPPALSSLQTVTTRRLYPMHQKETPARFHPAWTSYLGAVQGVLSAAGLTELDFDHLACMSGIGFHLVMGEKCDLASVTVYDWMMEHQQALDRVGVYSELVQVMPGSNSYDAASQRAVGQIKASIDRGVGVILWGVDTGEFGVVYGYHDEDQVFFTDGVFSNETTQSNPILYANVGRTFAHAPILHYQIPLAQVGFDREVAYRTSLEHYVSQMEKPHHHGSFQSGLKAYDKWISGLQRADVEHAGVRYTVFCYAEAKASAARYLRYLAENWQGLDHLPAVADAFEQVSSIYQQMMAVLGHDGLNPDPLFTPVPQEALAAMLPLVRKAKEQEVEALALVKRSLASR